MICNGSYESECMRKILGNIPTDAEIFADLDVRYHLDSFEEDVEIGELEEELAGAGV